VRKTALMIMAAMIIFSSCKKEEKFVPNNGIINFLSGTVSIIDEGKTLRAKTGIIIKEGMKIQTGRKSLVDIYFGGNVIRILEKSTVSMKELTREINSNKEILEFYVDRGKLFSRVSRKLKPGEKFKVSTPTVTAGVRGTEFLVEENRGKGKISCVEGVVAAKKSGEEDSKAIDVPAGKEAELGADNKFSVNDLKQENIDRINKIKEDIREIQKDIREKFEKQRDEIRKAVQDQKEKNKQMVQDQKAKDKENVERIKGETKEKSEAIKAEAAAKKDEAKGAVKDFKKPDIKGVKPDIKSFKK